MKAKNKADEQKVPEVTVEIKRIEGLKDTIKSEYQLGNEGIAFKITTHNSPYSIRYEKIKGNFHDNIKSLLKSSNLSPIIKRLRG